MYAPADGQRAALAGALAEASALAGWLALDRDDHDQAWRHHERAKHAAREADSPAPARPRHGASSRSSSSGSTMPTRRRRKPLTRAPWPTDGPALMRAWLAAAHGETLAARATETPRCAHSTMLRHFFRPTLSTQRCRSCSSAAPTSTAGAATPSPKSATPTRSTSSPARSQNSQRRGFEREPACSSTSPTPTPRQATATQRSATPAKPERSPGRSTPTASYGDSTAWSCRPDCRIRRLVHQDRRVVK